MDPPSSLEFNPLLPSTVPVFPATPSLPFPAGPHRQPHGLHATPRHGLHHAASPPRHTHHPPVVQHYQGLRAVTDPHRGGQTVLKSWNDRHRAESEKELFHLSRDRYVDEHFRHIPQERLHPQLEPHQLHTPIKQHRRTKSMPHFFAFTPLADPNDMAVDGAARPVAFTTSRRPSLPIAKPATGGAKSWHAEFRERVVRELFKEARDSAVSRSRGLIYATDMELDGDAVAMSVDIGNPPPPEMSLEEREALLRETVNDAIRRVLAEDRYQAALQSQAAAQAQAASLAAQPQATSPSASPQRDDGIAAQLASYGERWQREMAEQMYAWALSAGLGQRQAAPPGPFPAAEGFFAADAQIGPAPWGSPTNVFSPPGDAFTPSQGGTAYAYPW